MERQKYLGISTDTYYIHGIINKAIGNDDIAEKSFSKLISLIKTEDDKKYVLFILEIRRDDNSHSDYYKGLMERVNSKKLSRKRLGKF